MIPMTHNRREWAPRRADPEHRKCGCCLRTFYAGTLPPEGPERYGPFAGHYLCRDCRSALAEEEDMGDPLF